MGFMVKKTEHALEVFYSERDQIDNNELNQQDVLSE